MQSSLFEVLQVIPSLFSIKILHTDNSDLTFFTGLQNSTHNDPTDLLIISQAITNKFYLVSADKNFAYYQEKYGLKLITP